MRPPDCAHRSRDLAGTIRRRRTNRTESMSATPACFSRRGRTTPGWSRPAPRHAAGRWRSSPSTGGDQRLGGGRGHEPAFVVDDEGRPAARRWGGGVRGDEIRVHDRRRGRRGPVGWTQGRSGREDDGVGFQDKNVCRRRSRVQLHIDAGGLELVVQPVEAEIPALPTAAAAGDPRSAADLAGGLVQGDQIAGLGRAIGGFGTGHPAPDDDDPAGSSRLERWRRLEVRLPNGRVNRAPHRPALVEATNAALVQADARAGRTAGRSLARKIRIGDQGPSHGDEVDAVIGQRALGRRRVEDPPRHQTGTPVARLISPAWAPLMLIANSSPGTKTELVRSV